MSRLNISQSSIDEIRAIHEADRRERERERERETPKLVDFLRISRERDEWKAKYEATVAAWEESKRHREDDARRFDRLIEALRAGK
jgi:hypothetical protein